MLTTSSNLSDFHRCASLENNLTRPIPLVPQLCDTFTFTPEGAQELVERVFSGLGYVWSDPVERAITYGRGEMEVIHYLFSSLWQEGRNQEGVFDFSAVMEILLSNTPAQERFIEAATARAKLDPAILDLIGSHKPEDVMQEIATLHWAPAKEYIASMLLIRAGREGQHILSDINVPAAHELAL